MNTDRLILHTDRRGNLQGLPKFPPNKQIQAVFRIIDKPGPKAPFRRFPNRDIAGKIRILGNLFDTASEKDWNLTE